MGLRLDPELKKYKLTITLPYEFKKLFNDGTLSETDIRKKVLNYSEDLGITSDDWKALARALNEVPSLQLVGNVGAGKSHLIQELVQNDKSNIYIVMDSHNEHTYLPTRNQIPEELTESFRLEMPKYAEAAKSIFALHYNILTSKEFPKDCVFVVEEALRYKNNGLKNLMAESRKFVKVLAVCQEKMFDFCPSIRVKPYNQVDLRALQNQPEAQSGPLMVVPAAQDQSGNA